MKIFLILSVIIVCTLSFSINATMDCADEGSDESRQGHAVSSEKDIGIADAHLLYKMIIPTHTDPLRAFTNEERLHRELEDPTHERIVCDRSSRMAQILMNCAFSSRSSKTSLSCHRCLLRGQDIAKILSQFGNLHALAVGCNPIGESATHIVPLLKEKKALFLRELSITHSHIPESIALDLILVSSEHPLLRFDIRGNPMDIHSAERVLDFLTQEKGYFEDLQMTISKPQSQTERIFLTKINESSSILGVTLTPNASGETTLQYTPPSKAQKPKAKLFFNDRRWERRRTVVEWRVCVNWWGFSTHDT